MKYRAILSGLFVFLVLFSSSSFIIGLHICSGEIQNIALLGKAEGCAKEQQLPPCHRHEVPVCCDNETILHDGETFAAGVASIDLSPPTAVDLIQPALILAEVTPTVAVATEYFYEHDPPLPFSDLRVAFHSFLI